MEEEDPIKSLSWYGKIVSIFKPTSVISLYTGWLGSVMSNDFRLVWSTTYRKLPAMVNRAVEPPAPVGLAASDSPVLVQEMGMTSIKRVEMVMNKDSLFFISSSGDW